MQRPMAAASYEGGAVGELGTDVRVLPADVHGDCGRGERPGQEA